MKVTVVNFYGKGGMLYYAAEFANALAELAEVRLVLPKKVPGYYANVNCAVQLVEVPVPEDFSGKHLVRLPWYTLCLPLVVSRLRSGRPDIIHITNENIWLTALLPFVRDLHPVWTLHDPKPHVGDSLRKQLATRLLARFSRRILVHYQYNRRVAEEEGYDPAKLVVIPHGNYSFFENYRRDDIVARKMVLFWGRIRPYKGVETLIESARWLPQDVEVVIAGEGAGKYRTEIGSDDRFVILDRFLSERDIAELCQQCSVVAIPYVEATQSGIVPVAYAFSRPVVTTDVGGLPEQVEDGVTGSLVPRREPRLLAEAITRILNNPALARSMGEAGYAKSHTELSWSNVARIACSAYRELLNETK